MWSLVHLVYTISVLKPGWNPSPSVADHPLTWSLWICAGTRSRLDPVLFCQSISVSFTTGPCIKIWFLILGDNIPWGTQRGGRGRCTQENSVALSRWCEDEAAQTGAPHFCGQCSGFSCPWEGEGRSNTPSTDQILLGHRRHLLPVSLKFLTMVKYTGLLKLGGQKVKNKNRGKKKGRHCKMIDESCRQWEVVTNMKARLKSRTIYSDVASDETSVDFNGLQILPGGSKGSICTQVPPFKTKFPHLLNFPLKLVLHFTKHSCASGNSWLEVCSWDILEKMYTFRKKLCNLTATLHRTTARHQLHSTENGLRKYLNVSCCDVRSLLVKSVTWTRTKNRFFHLFQTFLPMAHKYLGERNRLIQHTSDYIFFSCF